MRCLTMRMASSASPSPAPSTAALDGSGFSVDVSKLGSEGDRITAQWFDPREDVYRKLADDSERLSEQAFDPPGAPGADNDWILVLSAAAAD